MVKSDVADAFALFEPLTENAPAQGNRFGSQPFEQKHRGTLLYALAGSGRKSFKPVFFSTQRLRERRETAPDPGRKLAFDKRQKHMADFIACVTEVGVARVRRVREMCRGHISHDLGASAAEE